MANDEIQVDLIIRKHLLGDLMLFLGGTVKVIKVSSVAPAPAAEPVAAPKPKKSARDGSWRETALAILRQPTKPSEIAAKMGVTGSAANWYVKMLKKEKKIKSVGGGQYRAV